MNIDIEIDDPDIESISVEWFGEDTFFINEKERGSGISHCVLLDRPSAVQVRDALNKFLSD